jgi:signal transduction histidine kinase
MAPNAVSAEVRWPPGSGVAALVREHSWQLTSLGPIASWPHALRTAVTIMLRLPMPASLQWGRDDVLLFNDAFAQLIDGDPGELIGRPNQDWQSFYFWRDQTDAREIPLADDDGAPAGTLTLFRVPEDSERMPLAPPRIVGRTYDTVEESYALLETKMVERATELARANEMLSASIAERSQAEDERKTLQRQLAAAEEAERGRLSRELHDQLGQHLTAIALGLHEVASMVRPGSPARERLSALQELTTLLTRDARYLAIELRPPELDDVGLESAMASYVDQWSHRYGITADLQSTGIVRFHYPADVSTALYRILQEALTNVAKHAEARQVSVILEHADDELRLIIEDDGKGFDWDAAMRRASDERRMGLLGMRERASIVGGTLTVESSPGHGATMYVRVPVR